MSHVASLFSMLDRALQRRDRTDPLTVEEIYQRHLPYRTVRTELGIVEFAAYERALLELLAGHESYLQLGDPSARSELQKELASPNPILGLYRDYGTAVVERMAQPFVRPPLDASPVEETRSAGDTEEAPPELTAFSRGPADPRPSAASGHSSGTVVASADPGALSQPPSPSAGRVAPAEFRTRPSEATSQPTAATDPDARDIVAAGSRDQDAAAPAQAPPRLPTGTKPVPADDHRARTDPPAAGISSPSAQAAPQEFHARPSDVESSSSGSDASSSSSSIPSLSAPKGKRTMADLWDRTDSTTDSSKTDSEPRIPKAGARRCIECEQPLPASAEVHFCPFCGRQQRPPECPECSLPLRAEWSFCIRCGTSLNA